MADWSLFSNHGLALICIARSPGMRLREIADCVGITERAASRIVGDLCSEGFLEKTRTGRRNSYELDPTRPVGHSLTDGHAVGEILAPLMDDAPSRSKDAA
ncbi:MAG TPA: winged helix-turn-helix domain-containing protein [Thermoleophilaceae bacterium]|nr:winged helix-turn-helix domain-containing protein [Thermoleophilaceae bacterium]